MYAQFKDCPGERDLNTEQSQSPLLGPVSFFFPFLFFFFFFFGGGGEASFVCHFGVGI